MFISIHVHSACSVNFLGCQGNFLLIFLEDNCMVVDPYKPSLEDQREEMCF